MNNQEQIKNVLAGLPEDDPSRQYLQSVLTTRALDPGKEQKLVEQLAADGKERDRARRELVTGNLQLAASMATGYLGCGVALADLIQEGNEGLTQAACQYKVEEGVDFQTYASWWIRQSITRAISSETDSHKVHEHLVDTMSKLVEQMRNLAKDLGRMPTEEEIAKSMDLSLEQLQELQGLVGTVVKVTPSADPEAEGEAGGGIGLDLVDDDEDMDAGDDDDDDEFYENRD